MQFSGHILKAACSTVTWQLTFADSGVDINKLNTNVLKNASIGPVSGTKRQGFVQAERVADFQCVSA